MSALVSSNNFGAFTRGSYHHLCRRLPLRTPFNLLGASHYIKGQGTDRSQWSLLVKKGTFLGMPLNNPKSIVSCPILKDTNFIGSESVKYASTCISKGQALLTTHFTTLAAAKVAQRKQFEERKAAKQDTGLGIYDIKGVYSQAQVRATFYPKFENEKSDQEVKLFMFYQSFADACILGSDFCGGKCGKESL
ncbi:hypothetical protein L7F22_038685 [Adiantum nelumboides]|nr:hypothetical protein [Adiantum nelumboides]